MAVERSRGSTGHVQKVYLPFSEEPQAYYDDHDITLAGDGRWVLDTVKRGDLFRISAVSNIGNGDNEAFAAGHVAPLPWDSEQYSVWYAGIPVVTGSAADTSPDYFWKNRRMSV